MLHKKTNGDGNFLSVKHHALCLESKVPKEGFELIEGDVDGQHYSKYIKKFGAVDGLITKIEWYDREHQGVAFRGLKIHMKDVGEHYSIDLPFEKRQYDYFTRIAENIDYSKPVRFEAWKDKQDERITAFCAKQDGKYIQWKYTKDDMGDCPPAKKLRSGKWDFNDQREWLLERVISVVAPQVEALNAFDEPMPEYETDTPEGVVDLAANDVEDDDIPF